MSLETKEELIQSVKEWIRIDSEIASFKSEIKNRMAKKESTNRQTCYCHEKE